MYKEQINAEFCIDQTWHRGYLVSGILGASIAMTIVGWIVITRRRTKLQLEARGIPTVLWRPKYINYRPFEEDHKLSSASITGVLPRMERLKGPFGMYGTVYGINTTVIHVGHPVPARAIFGMTTGSPSVPSERNHSSSLSSRRLSVADSTGASKSPAYDHFKNFCGEGVFTANGEDWKAKRTAIMHCLIRGTNSSLSDVGIRLEEEANRAADAFVLQVHHLQRITKQDRVVADIVPLLQRSTLGFIYRFITHHEPSWGAASEHEFEETKTKSALSSESCKSPPCDLGMKRKGGNSGQTLLERYLDSVVRIRMIILAQSRSIWFLLPRWCYNAFSSLHRDEQATVRTIADFAEQACRFAKPGSPLAKLQAMETYGGRGKAQNSRYFKDLMDETVTLLFAGQDTSASTLSWIIHLLSIHPEIQARLAKEVEAVMSQETSLVGTFRVTRNTIAKLPFLDAVVQESMRLYPVAPFVVRRLRNEICVDGQDECGRHSRTILPSNALACIWIYSLHRNPHLWDRPDDFVPERWLGDTKDIGQSNGAYMPFAGGPRNCIGQPIAHVVLRTVLAKLILRYDFYDERLESATSVSDLRIEMQAGFTVLPRGGVRVMIRPRNG